MLDKKSWNLIFLSPHPSPQKNTRILSNYSHFPLIEKLQPLVKLHPIPYRQHFPRRPVVSHQGCTKWLNKRISTTPKAYLKVSPSVSNANSIANLKSKSFKLVWAWASLRTTSKLGHLKTFKLPSCTAAKWNYYKSMLFPK